MVSEGTIGMEGISANMSSIWDLYFIKNSLFGKLCSAQNGVLLVELIMSIINKRLSTSIYS